MMEGSQDDGAVVLSVNQSYSTSSHVVLEKDLNPFTVVNEKRLNICRALPRSLLLSNHYHIMNML